MTPQARASAIRDLLAQVDVHMNALEIEGFKVSIINLMLTTDRTKSRCDFVAQRHKLESL